MKSLEDIVIDIAEWVKIHGPIKREFSSEPQATTKKVVLDTAQIIEQSRAITMLEGLTPREASGWQILYYEDVLIVFAGWLTPEGQLTSYTPNVQAVTSVFNLISAGSSIGEAVDTFMRGLEH